MKRLQGVLAAISLATLLLGAAAPSRAEDITYLLPAPLSLPAFGPFVLAQQRGYFKAEGLPSPSRSPRGVSMSPSRSAPAPR
jgi:NitT/TauT family transport system substrate-binding protein